MVIGVDGRTYRRLVRAGADAAGIIEVPVAGGPRHRLSRIPDGVSGLGRPGEVQLAEALVTGAQVRDRDVERGPRPIWWRLTLAVTALFIGAAILRSGRIRRTGRAQRPRLRRANTAPERRRSRRPSHLTSVTLAPSVHHRGDTGPHQVELIAEATPAASGMTSPSR
ncbi:hypothetical protein [Virgisporangium aurantiacum]|uniref:Uncharacterized protein n=1 Tax=Virgisporangium aurantiacum TaxID=175570 RepID=A0A8J3YYK2_9ACTN|nr:hypothetical protein [Virgisporangium aurantiacum]GIJ54106.1 hypothetical protein Vau01_016220 [Virgisporangium aurantiacum]